jgi:endo-1,4-beta-D-glucanase Y
MLLRSYRWIAGIFAAAGLVGAGWNLPYPQQPAYDYTTYYNESVRDYLQIVPTLFEDELAKGWSYYKSHFIMSNGLVNHQRLGSGGETIGTDEAVSEGQGYGLILALLNNDQPTFDRILEAANQYLWNGTTYGCWRWRNGCIESGAATDADLDIALALVFADKLAEKGFWTEGDAGVDYGEHAVKVIGGIRTGMVSSSGYLLPGDSWGGQGEQNLNPSYFATAWLKVFDAYQDQYDFSGVVDRCYEVLEKMPRYNVGQAADWITRDGGRASKGGLGMGNDAIRTPWRIAMDALWFGDPRAVEYCANSKGTLTEYTNSNKVYLQKQMGQYTESGTVVPDSWMCSEVAMWACAILGSNDAAYAREGLDAQIIRAIIGSTADFFGSVEVRDNTFYYKQSLAMLGFATITGQFPNVLADLSNPITVEPVALTRPLSIGEASVSLPASLSVTAAFDKATSWSVTFTGATSGTTETVDGSGDAVAVTWTGAGWYTVENVAVTLEAANLDEATTAGSLEATFAITAVPRRPDIEPGSLLGVHDCENGSTVNAWGGAWYSFTDADNGGSSAVTPVDASDLVQASAGHPGYGVTATFDPVDQYAGIGMHLTEKGTTLDLSDFEAVVFDYRTGGGLDEVLFMVTTANITNYAFNLVALSGTGGQWRTTTVRLADLQPPSWSPGTTMDPRVAEKLQWQVQNNNTGTLSIDNVGLQLADGKLPGADIEAIIQGTNAAPGRVVPTASTVGPSVRVDGGSVVVTGRGGMRVELFTALGRRRAAGALDRTGRLEIARNLPSGIYLLRVHAGNRRSSVGTGVQRFRVP